jgi:tetraacyldisaccharide 4'-kinase
MYLWIFVSPQKGPMFSNWFLKSFRLLLLPFALLYGLVIFIRNWLYDHNIIKSASFGLPLISVGNLSVGGTGKSPMVEYLVFHLKNRFKVATISRGYKRKTKGYALANENTTAIDIGDEPMQFYSKFPDVPIAVGEERIEAIPQLLHDHPQTEVIIMDDAFQHRSVRPGLSILLTDSGNLFTRDFFLPTGDLRDMRASYKRADIIIITKCKKDLPVAERDSIIQEIGPFATQKVYFTMISYGTPYHITSKELFEIKSATEVLLISGIASPRQLKKYLEEKVDTYSLMQYTDHHIFTIDDLQEMQERFRKLEGEDKILLTTEKDATRLSKFSNELNGMPFYVLPIEHKFLFEAGKEFNEQVVSFITNFKQHENFNGKEKHKERTS